MHPSTEIHPGVLTLRVLPLTRGISQIRPNETDTRVLVHLDPHPLLQADQLHLHHLHPHPHHPLSLSPALHQDGGTLIAGHFTVIW